MRQPRYHIGDLQEQVREQALVLLQQQGDPAITLRVLAKNLGVSATALYRHFENREALLADLAAEGFRRLEARLKQVPQDNPRRALIGIAQTYVEFARDEPNLYRLMFGGRILPRGSHPTLDAAGKAAFGVLQSTVAKAQASGYVNATPLATITAAAWSLVHGFADLTIDGHLPATEQASALTRAVAALLVDGIRNTEENSDG